MSQESRDACLIFGGVSLLFDDFDFAKLSRSTMTLFIEPRALTPLMSKVITRQSYVLAPFAEKLLISGAQNYFLAAKSAQYDLTKELNPSFLESLSRFNSSFDQFFEPGKRSVEHKKFRLKPNVFLNDSPFDLIKANDQFSVITFDDQLNMLPSGSFDELIDRIMILDRKDRTNRMDRLEVAQLGQCSAVSIPSCNSAVNSLWDLIFSMGYDRIFLIGFDMSLMGQMEYGGQNIFKELDFFDKFLRGCGTYMSGYMPRGLLYGIRQSIRQLISERKDRAVYANFVSAVGQLRRHAMGRRGKFLRTHEEMQDLRTALTLLPRHKKLIRVSNQSIFEDYVPEFSLWSYKQFYEEL